jgi:hypothetical protein
MKIAIVTNYQSEQLYSKCREFYKDAPYEQIGISGKGGFYGWHFLDYITRTLDYDWVILIDEDCFVTDLKALDDLLIYQIDNKIHCSGVPDGGVLNTRRHNPTSINTFFSILNLSEIKKKYNTEDVFNKQHLVEKFKHLTPTHLLKSDLYKYDDFEPYYRYFFWLHENNFKVLFLDGEDFYRGEDKWTSIVKWNGNKIGYHTWIAREYDIPNSIHRQRIDQVYEHCVQESMQ